MHKLPGTLMITGSDSKLEEQFFKKILLHLNNGIKLLQLRAKELEINGNLSADLQKGYSQIENYTFL